MYRYVYIHVCIKYVHVLKLVFEILLLKIVLVCIM